MLKRGLFRGLPRVYTYAIVGGTMALLIWMKLRVVTGVPRTAYADPEGKPSNITAPAGIANAKTAPGSQQAAPKVEGTALESTALVDETVAPE